MIEARGASWSATTGSDPRSVGMVSGMVTAKKSVAAPAIAASMTKPASKPASLSRYQVENADSVHVFLTH